MRKTWYEISKIEGGEEEIAFKDLGHKASPSGLSAITRVLEKPDRQDDGLREYVRVFMYV
jgi:hypothetical protein